MQQECHCQEGEWWHRTTRMHHRMWMLYKRSAFIERLEIWLKKVAPSEQVPVKTGSPVAPKVLPLGNSHIPARSWARPPQKMAIPTTTLGWVMPRVWRLYKDNMKVVEAKENKPLYRILFSWTNSTWVGGQDDTYSAAGFAMLAPRRVSWDFSRSIWWAIDGGWKTRSVGVELFKR